METVTINDERYNARVAELYDVLVMQGRSGDAATIIEDEARLFLKQAIRLTPPRTKAQGEQAIHDDLNRIFSGGNDAFLNHVVEAFGSDHVQQWFTNKRGEKYLMDVNHISVDGDGMYDFHQKNRTKRGRTTMAGQYTRDIGRWKEHNKFVVGYGALAKYRAKIKDRVGMRKGGWLRAFYEVGGKLPQWIQRHARRGLGSVQNNLDVPNHPSIIMASHAPGVMDDERILKDTFRARGEAIKKRIRLIVSGYAADVKAGIKIRNHAKRSAD